MADTADLEEGQQRDESVHSKSSVVTVGSSAKAGSSTTTRSSLHIDRIPSNDHDSTYSGKLHAFLTRFDVRIWVAVSIILLFFIIPASIPDAEGDHFLISGGLLGILSSCYVFYNYLAKPQKRVPPIPLLLWRSVCDFGIAMRFLADSDSRFRAQNCSWKSTTLEFFEVASEGWFLCVGLDLLISATNPFSSFNDRLKHYHYFVWIYASLLSIILTATFKHGGIWSMTDDGETVTCWIRMDRNTPVNYVPWLFFYFPTISIYVFSVVAVLFAYLRLRNGIPKTMVHRLRVMVMNTINVSISVIYWSILGSFYIASYFTRDKESNKWLYYVIVFLMASKGIISFLVYVIFDSLNISGDDEVERVDLNTVLRGEVMFHTTRGLRKSTHLVEKLRKDHIEKLVGQRSLTFLLNGGEKKSQENLFSFWFFLKLMFGSSRELQVVRQLDKETRVGSMKKNTMDKTIEDEIKRMNNVGSEQDADMVIRQTDFIRMSEILAGEAQVDDDEVTELSKVEANHDKTMISTFKKRLLNPVVRYLRQFQILEKVDFTVYEPYHFYRIREAAGVSEPRFVNAFKSVLKERLVQGGASGAFFFFSDGEQFIAKSCSKGEMDTLVDNAGKFADYFSDSQNKNTFISKIYGAYRLRMYGVSLYFFVMMNIFLNDEQLVINEKYDIKGSWVSRNASPAIHGQMINCTNCGVKYRYMKKKDRGVDRNNTPYKGPLSSVGTSSNYLATQKKQTTMDILFKMRRKGGMADVTGISNPLNSHFHNSPAVTRNLTGTSTASSKTSDDFFVDRCHYTVDGQHEPNVILKDNDLKAKVMLTTNVARELRRQLKQDAAFLCSIGVMDYSLLVGVHKNTFDLRLSDSDTVKTELSDSSRQKARSILLLPREHADNVTSTSLSGDVLTPPKRPLYAQRNSPAPGGDGSANPDNNVKKDCDIFTSKKFYANKVVGPDVYLLGIIDFQQRWNLNKKIERFLKTVVKGEDGDGISAIEPVKYYQRFVSKVDDIF